METPAAEPFTARHCSICDTWVSVQGEGTKTTADLDHWVEQHQTGPDDRRPFARWNENPVAVVV